MGTFVITSETRSSAYEYKNNDVIVNGNFNKNGQTDVVNDISGTIYRNNENAQGEYICNFSGYNRDGNIKYSFSEFSMADAAIVLAAVNEIQQNIIPVDAE